MIGSQRGVGNGVKGSTADFAGDAVPGGGGGMATSIVTKRKPAYGVKSSGRGGGKATLSVNMRNSCKDGVSLRIGSANVGTMRGRSGEVVDMAARRRLDFCCLQETKWRGGSARIMGGESARYKFFWSVSEEGVSGVGVLVAERWIESILEVERMSERLMVVRLVVGRSVVNLVCVYAPQVGRSMEEKEEFLLLLCKTLSGINCNERVVVGGDFNCHVGADADGYDGVHGGQSFGQRNLEGEMFLELAGAMELIVANTWFKKRVNQMVTYESGQYRTVVDYVLVRKQDRELECLM